MFCLKEFAYLEWNRKAEAEKKLAHEGLPSDKFLKVNDIAQKAAEEFAEVTQNLAQMAALHAEIVALIAMPKARMEELAARTARADKIAADYWRVIQTV